MKNKKLLALVLAGTMLLAVAASAATSPTASATDGTLGATGGEMNATGAVEPVIVSATLPTTMSFVIDPYKVQEKSQVITATAARITNLGNTRLSIYVSEAIGTPSADVNIVKTEPTARNLTKDAYLFLRTADRDSTKGIPALGTPPRGDTEGNVAKYTAASATKGGDVLVDTAAPKAALLLVTLDKKDGTAGADDVAFGIAGAASPTPTVAWDGTETVAINAKFTFKAVDTSVDLTYPVAA